jgi:small subunit ribosomal protein S20
MPNTASAESRARNSAKKQLRNKSVKSRLKTLEKNYEALAASGKKEEAAKAYRAVTSALDKAAKTGVVHSATASRKKSRLAKHLKPAK